MNEWANSEPLESAKPKATHESYLKNKCFRAIASYTAPSLLEKFSSEAISSIMWKSKWKKISIRICESFCHLDDFDAHTLSDLQTQLPLPEFLTIGQWGYLIAIINKTPLRNGNCPITNLITKMGVAHTVGPWITTLHTHTWLVGWLLAIYFERNGIR